MRSLNSSRGWSVKTIALFGFPIETDDSEVNELVKQTKLVNERNPKMDKSRIYAVIYTNEYYMFQVLLLQTIKLTSSFSPSLGRSQVTLPQNRLKEAMLTPDFFSLRKSCECHVCRIEESPFLNKNGNKLMNNWWFGARCFKFLGSPYKIQCYLGVHRFGVPNHRDVLNHQIYHQLK